MSSRPVLLDAFCGAGGCTKGYQRAGFYVVGIDIKPQPNYCGDEFIQTDALALLADSEFMARFACAHASPPCQAYSPLNALSPDKTYPDLIVATRTHLAASGLPWVIENVMTAPLDKARSIVLCGGMFGLRTYRHRRFEPSMGLDLIAPAHLKHVVRTATSRRRERWNQGWHVSITGDVGTYLALEAMGIDWMNGNELCEAIPPPYTEYVGGQLMAEVNARQEVAA